MFLEVNFHNMVKTYRVFFILEEDQLYLAVYWRSQLFAEEHHYLIQCCILSGRSH